MQPPAPQDAETRTIIDKLAEFVARNGPEFENITKKKQLTNPKFSFLYGGEHYNYYKHRVWIEQRLLAQQQQPPPPIQCSPNLVNLMGPTNQMFLDMANGGAVNNTSCPPPPIPPTMNPPPVGPPPPGNLQILAMQIENLNGQQNTLREQIKQSEQNLQAQHTSLMQQQQKAIEEMLPHSQKDFLQKQAAEENIDLAAFDQVLNPIIDSCTKDNISAGKNFILQYSTGGKRAKVVLQHLLQRSMEEQKFGPKLHLIYLVNDVLHHCARKNAEDVKKELEIVVIPMFCSAQLIATDSEAQKLTKLLTLWESKGNFFDATVISKLRSPESSMQEYNVGLEAAHNSTVTAMKQSTKATLDNYEQQHQAFMNHATQQIAAWEAQKQGLEQQMAALNNLLQSPPPPMFMGPNSLPPPNAMMNEGPPHQQQQQHQQQGPPPGMNMMHPMDGLMPPGMQMLNPGGSHPMDGLPPPPPPPRNNFLIPDLSRPPPGFGAPPEIPPPQIPPQAPPPVVVEEAPPVVVPKTPYFNLPAGLMAPFIRLEDCSYKPLDPDDIVLPPPAPPSERLLMAVDSFYSLPSHERPRDGDGWEKLALYEYYKVKNQARKQKEEAIQKGVRERSRSPSPIVMEPRVKRQPKRRYRSESRSPERRSNSRGRERERERKEKQQPGDGEGDEEGGAGESDRGRGRTRDRERERSRSRERDMRRRSPSGGRRHSRDRRSNSPAAYESSGGRSRGRQRDISPPSTPVIGFKQSSNNSIDQSNKGHQMLLKMGWAGAGTGLGVAGQGIDKPIDGGQVRDRQDIYKGVGMNMNDPYENFRKNKGAAFITRMKARADDKV